MKMFDGFYPASAHRRIATHKDIIPNKIFKTYEEACKYLAEYGHDSDDAVFIKLNKKWMRVIGYNEAGELLARSEKLRFVVALKTYPVIRVKNRQF